MDFKNFTRAAITLKGIISKGREDLSTASYKFAVSPCKEKRGFLCLIASQAVEMAKSLP